MVTYDEALAEMRKHINCCSHKCLRYFNAEQFQTFRARLQGCNTAQRTTQIRTLVETSFISDSVAEKSLVKTNIVAGYAFSFRLIGKTVCPKIFCFIYGFSMDKLTSVVCKVFGPSPQTSSLEMPTLDISKDNKKTKIVEFFNKYLLDDYEVEYHPKSGQNVLSGFKTKLEFYSEYVNFCSSQNQFVAVYNYFITIWKDNFPQLGNYFSFYKCIHLFSLVCADDIVRCDTCIQFLENIKSDISSQIYNTLILEFEAHKNLYRGLRDYETNLRTKSTSMNSCVTINADHMASKNLIRKRLVGKNSQSKFNSLKCHPGGLLLLVRLF
mmetsp:Transcript_5158/g.8588  ORF Transcript_5158/g.8588 Transcript_5158/m.8588 type:complete len:325 (+) Transcript_5158:472-1446(+)